jgi:glycosyltransferase involved in cell wall biosynthesis
MPAILAEIPEALFLVVGGIEARPELPELVRRLNLLHAVELIGWQDFSRMPSYIEASAVGVLPHEPGEHSQQYHSPQTVSIHVYAKAAGGQ